MDGSAYAGKSKLQALFGENFVSKIRGRDVIDFGCGHGDESIEMAVAGARSVTGVDIQDNRFLAAEAKAAAAGVNDRVAFTVSTLAPADVIISGSSGFRVGSRHDRRGSRSSPPQ